jgi:hypothetical protein
MDISVILAIIGVITTLLFGFLSIYLAIKRRYPGRITFIKENIIGLFDSIVRNMPDLSMHYEGKPVNENLVLLKGCFLNSGTQDITSDMVTDKLTIELPNGFKWLTGKVVSSSPNVHAEMKIQEETKLLFDLGLFRCNEYTRFEALAEIPSPQPQEIYDEAANRLNKAITFSHRISNTRKVEEKELIPSQDFRRQFRRMLFMSGGYVILVILIIGISWLWRGLPKEMNYKYKTDNYGMIEVKVIPQSNGLIKLQGVNNNYSEIIPATSFFVGCKWEPSIIISSSWKENLWVIGILTAFIIFLVFLYWLLFQREKRYRNILSNE